MIKKFVLILVVSIIFVSCNVFNTELKVYSSNGIEVAFFEDFFDYEIVVKDTNSNFTIVIDKNTEVLYIAGYQQDLSPIYDSNGSILTKEKWLAKRAKRKD